MPKIVDRKDVRYGRLVAIDYFYKSFSTGRKYIAWHCKCDCGKETIAGSVSLNSGAKQSCGCLQKEAAIENSKKSLIGRHCESGKNKTAIYSLYHGIMTRVSSKRPETAIYYLNKGITICDEWKTNYLSFKKWAIENGYKKGLIIDRIDNSKGYAPDNCRFVTAKQSSRNTSSNRILTINGVNKTVADWCDYYKIDSNLARGRLWRGWSAEAIFTAKKHTRIKKQKPVT